MDSHDQRFVPESFLALYRGPRGRLQIDGDALMARYELCEDMAQMLSPAAQGLCTQVGADADEAAAHLVRVASSEGSTLTEAEWGWVRQRLAELLAS